MKILPHELVSNPKVSGPFEKESPAQKVKTKKPPEDLRGKSIDWKAIKPHCKDMYPEEIAEYWGISLAAVKSARQRKTIQCKKHRTKGAKWCRGETTRMVAQMVGKFTIQEMANILGVKRTNIYYHLEKLGVKA